MKRRYVIITAFTCIFSIFFVYLGFSITNQWQTKKNIYAQENKMPIRKTATTYRSKDKPNEKKVTVEIEVIDDLTKDGGKIFDVIFYGKVLPLRPPGSNGERGVVYFEIPPGKYKIQWTVNYIKYEWPRTSKLDKIINIEDTQTRAYILIKGDNITVTNYTEMN